MEGGLICKKSSQVFYLDYGFADEDVMENQIKYPPIQAQKLVIEGMQNLIHNLTTTRQISCEF